MAKKLPAGFTQRKDGRLQLLFTMEGKRYAVYGKTVKECKEKEIIKRQEITKGLDKRKNPTMQEYIDTWLENKRLNVKESTFRGQRQILGVISKIHI